MNSYIESYVHQGRIGVLIEIEARDHTTFLTHEFRILCKDLAMHIAASDPVSITSSSQAGVFRFNYSEKSNLLSNDGQALLAQRYYRNEKLTVSDIIHMAEEELGENLGIVRFVRYETVGS